MMLFTVSLLILGMGFGFHGAEAVHTLSQNNYTCVHGTYPPQASKRVKEYVINLDLPPIERWKQLATEKKQEIANVLLELVTYVGEFGIIPKELIYFIKLLGPSLVEVLPQPFQDEIKGIASATGIEIGEVVVYNIFYEIFTLCTSIVAEDPSGRLFHARNLDFGLFLGWDVKKKAWKIPEVLRPTVVNLDFQRGNKTVFKAVNFAGYVGIITGMSPGKFSLTMNERFELDGGYIGIINKIINNEGAWMGFLTRNILETAQSYEEAVSILSNTQLIAPAYYILGGNKPGQACVITRDREVNTTDVWQMKDAEKWYVLQTNYDHKSAPFPWDDRRTPGNRCMAKMSQKGVSYAGIFDVLSSKPVLNKLTVYTALMQVETGHLESWLQDCKDPCDPW